MDKAMLDFYSNVILSSFSRLTATSASALTDGTISHEENHAIQRVLGRRVLEICGIGSSRWCDRFFSEDGVLIVDDTIARETSYG